MKPVNEIDLKRWRDRALWPGNNKISKAEEAFDRALFGEKNAPRVNQKDFDMVVGLLVTFWNLQDEISDEDITDAHMQIGYINQQNDIRDELEKIFEKYLPDEEKTNKRKRSSRK